jgi:hypothetical protein
MNGERSPLPHPVSVQPLIQSLSGTLANLDSEHARELQKLDRSKADRSLKEQLRATLAQTAPRETPALRSATRHAQGTRVRRHA